MKLKSKGKVYPSPSSSSSIEDYLSILKLLPATILALISVLSLEDRQVLAYLINRSLKTTTIAAAAAAATTTTSNSFLISSKKGSSKKPPPKLTTQKSGVSSHKPPVFDCDCFDCYTSYWFRWDSSPNREIINQAIEAFEDHLTNGESQNQPSKKNVRSKRRDSNCKTVTPVPDIPVLDLPGRVLDDVPVLNSSTEEAPVFAEVVTEVAKVTTKEFPMTEDADRTTAEAAVTTTSNHKGLARKVLPDVIGLLNSRLWGLWNPNV